MYYAEPDRNIDPILSVLVLVSVNVPSEILKIKIRVRVYAPETRRYDGYNEGTRHDGQLKPIQIRPTGGSQLVQ